MGNPFGIRESIEGSATQPALNNGLATLPHPGVVHGEDLEENFAILFWVARRGHEHAEDGSAHQNERLAAPPFAKASERLPVVRLALLIRLRGEPGDGELGFDEG